MTTRYAGTLTTEHLAAQSLLGLLALSRLIRKERTPAPTQGQAGRFQWRPAAALRAIGAFAMLTYNQCSVLADGIPFRERNFFGVKYVREYSMTKSVDFYSGSTLHGTQLTPLSQRSTPTLYYRAGSGVGLLLNNYPRPAGTGRHLRVGLIGMGVGTLAAYGRAGDVFRFYEIDPAAAFRSFA